jgi:hypothetical protein
LNHALNNTKMLVLAVEARVQYLKAVSKKEEKKE